LDPTLKCFTQLGSGFAGTTAAYYNNYYVMDAKRFIKFGPDILRNLYLQLVEDSSDVGCPLPCQHTTYKITLEYSNYYSIEFIELSRMDPTDRNP
jgi:hypothetical protein